jgi:hypothetical protein
LTALITVVAYPEAWRWLAGGLFALSRISLVVIAIMFAVGWVISPPLLVRLIVFLALVPGVLVILLRKTFAAECELSEGKLSVRRTGFWGRGKISAGPAESRDWNYWVLPAPGPGLSIRLAEQNGLRRLALETKYTGVIASALAGGSSNDSARLGQATHTYSQAKADSRAARWHWPLLKFGLFGLFPLFVVFRLHQNVMFGGLLGQYYLHGLGPWLSTLAYYWIMMTIYLVLYAAFWRSWIEAACWLTARYAPARAGTVRTWGEVLALTVYFAGIPAFIVWRSFV